MLRDGVHSQTVTPDDTRRPSSSNIQFNACRAQISLVYQGFGCGCGYERRVFVVQCINMPSCLAIIVGMLVYPGILAPRVGFFRMAERRAIIWFTYLDLLCVLCEV